MGPRPLLKLKVIVDRMQKSVFYYSVPRYAAEKSVPKGPWLKRYRRDISTPCFALCIVFYSVIVAEPGKNFSIRCGKVAYMEV